MRKLCLSLNGDLLIKEVNDWVLDALKASNPLAKLETQVLGT